MNGIIRILSLFGIILVSHGVKTTTCNASHDAANAKNGNSVILQRTMTSSTRGGESKSKPIGRSSATMNGLKNSAASALAAGCSKALLAPFDTIKTMQQQARNANGGISKSLSLMDTAKLIQSRPRGFVELYAGLGVSVIGAMPSVGLYFGVYSYCKEKLIPMFQEKLTHKNNNVHSPFAMSKSGARTLAIASSAAIGNTVASFSRVPYEVVKQKLQTGEFASTFEALKHMASTGGMRAFFPMGGVSIQMYRDIPYAIVTLLTYECLRDHWVNKKRDKEATRNGPWRDMVSGGLAGGIGSFVTNPMDVIKTRLQVDSQLYRGDVWVCASKTLEEGGPAAFLRGSVPRLIHKIPANAFFFVFYEGFRRLLGVDDDENED
jgi:solute carrier family 25 S-adenosylmethionine transporter 26